MTLASIRDAKYTELHFTFISEGRNKEDAHERSARSKFDLENRGWEWDVEIDHESE